ncbi:hypothetical protein, variant 3 [Aphanomyces invadans]|uniref:Rhodanese domain-containing protein n=2 Tax=Aphanomyces invadans TaxID=157072 RepID=A0A024U044_9STRA|nr:hypothetical protein, variant 2 [Aphanomyces invadans]XP_008871818.1 hypothetical protein, variant 3 [Aphanomyces invadans]ETV99261.1 hypothetical protein, variant 2 [Aphanomyces invadans]ETV99262.1 hypothetical protein, variant 3 [Aphanomyces invadans]|eukprot:XP_008871817.1 hypothetical protein, variant 2 [Aphanomyces invadans]
MAAMVTREFRLKMARLVDRITAKELVEILKNPEAKSAVRIVDVRDVDFAGGHIRGAINVPEEHFHDDDEVDNFVEEMKSVPTVIFHCMMRSAAICPAWNFNV